MSKRKTSPKPSRGPVLYLRLDQATEDAITAFIAAQAVPPDRTAVAMTAIHQFLEKHGAWPPPKKP